MRSRLSWILVVAIAVLGAKRASAEPRAYIAGGGELGNGMGLVEDAAIEGGVSLGNAPVLLHLGIAHGTFDDLSEAVGTNDSGEMRFFRGDGSFTRARAGVEGRSCTTTGTWCALYGVDLAVMRTGDTTGPRSDTLAVHYTAEQVVPRLGVDVGGQHLRLRVTLDAALGAAQRSAPQHTTETYAGVMLGSALAYQF